MTKEQVTGSKLTQVELEQGREFLNLTREGAIGATVGMSEAQWSFKPAEDRWSIAEILEHVVMVQERVLGIVGEELAKTPASELDPNAQTADALVIFQFPNRFSRFKGPDPLHPKGRLTPREALERLSENQAKLAEHLESTPDLRLHRIDAPPMKAVSKGVYETMDGYQWILAAAAHTSRHTGQILEVKAHASFPVR
jgi:hypothetical protein